ncbi:MAG: hypothetical protein ACI9S8_001034 [Chlamydiales bacterium]|jgi:hypothetical protein
MQQRPIKAQNVERSELQKIMNLETRLVDLRCEKQYLDQNIVTWHEGEAVFGGSSYVDHQGPYAYLGTLESRLNCTERAIASVQGELDKRSHGYIFKQITEHTCMDIAGITSEYLFSCSSSNSRI